MNVVPTCFSIPHDDSELLLIQRDDTIQNKNEVLP